MATDDPTTTAPDLTGTANASASAIGLLTSAITNLGSKISDLVSKQSSFVQSQKETIDITKAGSDALDIFSIRVLGASNAFADFSQHANSIQNFTQQLQGLGNATNIAGNLFHELAKAGGASSTVLNGTTSVIKGFVTEMAAAADNAINLQQGYLAMAGASGGLGTALSNAGTHLVDINSMMMKHRTLVDDIASSTGASAKQVAGFYMTLGSAIPGFVNQEVKAANEAGQSMTGLEATMALASGTGRDFKSVVTDMTTAYENFNASEQQALEWTARMSDLSSKFGINLSYTKGFLEDNAKAFKMISDNAGDADKTFNRMFESFKGTGLSAKQSTDIISQMTTQLSHLTVAQKAFLSAQTGGPGGLRGAFRIDNMLREGKIDEVMQLMEQNLKKHFGGRIYTQKEAETSDFAANQFLKQRQMVQSGAFGGLVKDDASATRVLEAMKAGTSTKEALRDPTTMLQKTIDSGQDVQRTTNTILNQILHAIERERGIAENNALDVIQRIGGSTYRNDRGAAGDELATSMRQNTSRMTNAANVSAFQIEGGRTRPQDIENMRLNNFKSVADDLGRTIPASFKDAFEKFKTELTSKNPQERQKGVSDYQDYMQELTKKQNELARDMTKSSATDEQKNQYKEYQQARAQFIQLSNQFNEGQFSSRGLGTAQAVQNAQNIPQPANRAPARNPGRAGDAPVERSKPQQEVLVTINGVVCEQCHKPLTPNAHTHVVTQGTR